MTDEDFEKALEKCANGECITICPISQVAGWSKCTTHLARTSLAYINRLKSAKQLSETQLKEFLVALYQRTDEESVDGFTRHKGITLYRQDIVGLAKDYGIKEEELK